MVVLAPPSFQPIRILLSTDCVLVLAKHIKGLEKIRKDIKRLLELTGLNSNYKVIVLSASKDYVAHVLEQKYSPEQVIQSLDALNSYNIQFKDFDADYLHGLRSQLGELQEHLVRQYVNSHPIDIVVRTPLSRLTHSDFPGEQKAEFLQSPAEALDHVRKREALNQALSFNSDRAAPDPTLEVSGPDSPALDHSKMASRRDPAPADRTASKSSEEKTGPQNSDSTQRSPEYPNSSKKQEELSQGDGWLDLGRSVYGCIGGMADGANEYPLRD